MTTPLASSLQKIVAERQIMHLERSRIIKGIWINVLAKAHPFLLGPPGADKSRMARMVQTSVPDANWWETLFNNQLSIDDIFGPPDMVAFDVQKVWRRNIEGRAAWCHLGLMDEVFKANGAVRTPLLSTMNERLTHNISEQPITANAISFIMASNEMFEDEESGAFWDRRGSFFQVDYIVEEGNFEKLLLMAAGKLTLPPQSTTISLADLQTAVDKEVPAIDMPAGILDAMRELKSMCEHPTDGGPQVIISDRRWFNAVRLVQASAYFEGRSVADDDDLQVLADYLPESPEMADTIVTRVTSQSSPQTAAAQEISKQVDAISTKVDGLRGQSSQAKAEYGAEANGKIRKMFAEIADLEDQAHAAGRSTTKIEEVKDGLTHLRRKVFVECLGVPAEAAEKV